MIRAVYLRAKLDDVRKAASGETLEPSHQGRNLKPATKDMVVKINGVLIGKMLPRPIFTAHRELIEAGLREYGRTQKANFRVATFQLPLSELLLSVHDPITVTVVRRSNGSIDVAVPDERSWATAKQWLKRRRQEVST